MSWWPVGLAAFHRHQTVAGRQPTDPKVRDRCTCQAVQGGAVGAVSEACHLWSRESRDKCCILLIYYCLLNDTSFGFLMIGRVHVQAKPDSETTALSRRNHESAHPVFPPQTQI